MCVCVYTHACVKDLKDGPFSIIFLYFGSLVVSHGVLHEHLAHNGSEHSFIVICRVPLFHLHGLVLCTLAVYVCVFAFLFTLFT